MKEEIVGLRWAILPLPPPLPLLPSTGVALDGVDAVGASPADGVKEAADSLCNPLGVLARDFKTCGGVYNDP